MGIISDKISWLRDGERANAALFNRPLSQVVSEIENRLFNSDGTTTSSTLKRAFEPSDKGTIASGDFVYLDPNTGKLEKAIADGSEKANVLGICQITRSQAGQEELSVATQGEVKIIGKTLEVGKSYYLSAQTAGDFSTDETDVLLGIALKEDVLLIKASGKCTGRSDAEIEATYAKKTDLDTLATKTELNDYLSKTDAETTYAKKTDLNSFGLKNIKHIVTEGNSNSPQKITELTVAGVDKKPQQISLNGTVLNPDRYTFQDGKLKFVDAYVVYGDILTITISI